MYMQHTDSLNSYYGVFYTDMSGKLERGERRIRLSKNCSVLA